MNWIGQKISQFKASLGRKVGHALNVIGGKINHPYVGHLIDNMENLQNRYRLDGREPDDVYRGAQVVKRILEVPERIGSFFQTVGTSLSRQNQ